MDIAHFTEDTCRSRLRRRFLNEDLILKLSIDQVYPLELAKYTGFQ